MTGDALEQTSAPARLGRAAMGFAAALFVLAFVAIVVAADRRVLPEFIRRLYDWPGGDKAGHVIVLAVLSFLVNAALGERRVHVGTLSLQLGSLLLVAGISLEEASQGFFPGRTLSLADLACSYLGIYLGSRAAGALRRAILHRTNGRGDGSRP